MNYLILCVFIFLKVHLLDFYILKGSSPFQVTSFDRISLTFG